MTVRCRLATRAVTALAGLTVLALSSVAQAQEPWAAESYRYRRPLTVQNPSTVAASAGDVKAFSYVPDYGVFDRKGRVDGKDVKIVYFNGSANVEVPQVLLPMGNSAAKILFQLQQPIAGSAADTGYRLYYGYPGDDGKAGRVAPPADKVVGYNFDDNTGQGWTGVVEVNAGAAGLAGSLTAANGALVMTGDEQVGWGGRGTHPVAVASNQTTLLTDSLVYARMRATGEREVAIMARADSTGNGYGLFVDGFGSQAGILGRTAPAQAGWKYDILSNTVPFSTQDGVWQHAILRVTGSGADVQLSGKAFPDGQSEPAGWMFNANVAATEREWARYDAGTLGVTGYHYWDDWRQYIDFVYATDANAEGLVFAHGDESVNANLGVIQGTVTFNGVGLKDATVTLVPAAGASSTVNTDAAGQYMALAPTGSYTVEFSSLFPKVFAAQTKSATLGSTPVTLNADLVAFDNIVENPSFEEVDPEFSGKPRGWFRRTYGGIADFAPDGSDKNTDRVPWIYSSTEARTGTRSVGFAGTTSNIQSWEVEGSAKTVNQDNRGGAALPRLPQGATITYSFYYKKATANGDVRHRPRYTNADDVNVLIGGGASNSTNAVAADWTKFEASYTNADPATWTNPNYLAYRIYGVNNPAGEPVYVDDVVVKVTGIPAVTSLPKTFRGYVRDSAGNPIPNAMVGLSDTGYNALAAPVQTAITDGVGRFRFTITDFSKTWQVQAMTSTIKNEENPLRGGEGGAVLYNNLASANVLLPADAAQDVVITYNPVPTINLAAGAGLAVIDDTQPVDSAARYAISGFGDPKILENNTRTVTTITDNDIVTRVSLDAGDTVGGRKYPRFIVIDLGREYEFGTQVKQIQLRTDPAPVQGIQVRVSSTLPPATMTGYTQTSYTDPALSPALAWGKPVYISPNGTPINVPHPDPGDESRTLIDPINNNRVRTITEFLTDGGTRIKGRYVMLLIVNSKWNVSPVEFTVEAANGTITGTVKDNTTGQPVADAFVGIHPNGANYGKTDANGNYTVIVPTFAPVTLQAHKSVDGATVYPLTDVLTVNAIGGETVTAPDLFLSAPVANVLIGSTAAQDYPGKGEEAPNVIGNIVDGDLATRWVTQPMAASDVDPTFPLNVDIDAGSAKQMNQLVLHWEAANASQYSVLVSTVFDQDPNAGTWTKVFETTQGTGGYQANGTTRTVDVISFPTQAVRYIRLVLSEEGRVSDRLSLWEVQGANAVAGAPGRADVVKIMAIVGGLQSATAGDKTRLDVNTDGKVDVLDAAQILKSL